MSSEEVEVHHPIQQPVIIPTAKFGEDLPESKPPSLPSVPLSRMNKSQKSVEESIHSGRGKSCLSKSVKYFVLFNPVDHLIFSILYIF